MTDKHLECEVSVIDDIKEHLFYNNLDWGKLHKNEIESAHH